MSDGGSHDMPLDDPMPIPEFARWLNAKRGLEKGDRDWWSTKRAKRRLMELQRASGVTLLVKQTASEVCPRWMVISLLRVQQAGWDTGKKVFTAEEVQEIRDELRAQLRKHNDLARRVTNLEREAEAAALAFKRLRSSHG